MRPVAKIPMLAAVLVLAFGLGGCATDAKLSSPSFEQQVEAAKTPTDHQAIAAIYDQKAAEARSQADVHRRMLKTYGAGPSGRVGFDARAHCGALVSKYQEIATEYVGLADYHRAMAKNVQP